MREKEKMKLFNSVTNVDERFIEEAQEAYKAHNNTQGNAKRTTPALLKWGLAAAASIGLIAAGIFAWKSASKPHIDAQNPEPSPAGSKVTISAMGVTIPSLHEYLSFDDNVGSEWVYQMMPFFCYQGRYYVPYDTLNNTQVVGERLGTARGNLSVGWGLFEECLADFEGTVKGDVYTVKGYDPEFMLCFKDSDGGKFHVYICNNGITMKNGSELFEDRLHLAGNYCEVQYQTGLSVWAMRDERYRLNDKNDSVIKSFIDTLNASEFMLSESIPMEDDQLGYDEKTLYILRFRMENGLEFRIRLVDGGYVCFNGMYLADVCIRMPEKQFNELLNCINDPTAWTKLEQTEHVTTLEDCANVDTLGLYIPSYVPDGLVFASANIWYEPELDTLADTDKVLTVLLEYSSPTYSKHHYRVEIVNADDYEDIWAIPIMDASELSVEAVKEYAEAFSSFPIEETRMIDVCVRYDDVLVWLSSQRLSFEDVYLILASIQEFRSEM